MIGEADGDTKKNNHCIRFRCLVQRNVVGWETKLPPDYYDELRLSDDGRKEIAAAL